MTDVVLIGLAGNKAIWMVDFDQKTVTQLPQEVADKVGQDCRPTIKGVDYAVAFNQASPVAAGKFDTVDICNLK